mmetsp:Transcript_31702/g.66188  ORF Transcript_31702/g.66188 Transcript_31702/m.66188 type:complete len:202 (+) Transcript_31702:153-758(+)
MSQYPPGEKWHHTISISTIYNRNGSMISRLMMMIIMMMQSFRVNYLTRDGCLARVLTIFLSRKIRKPNAGFVTKQVQRVFPFLVQNSIQFGSIFHHLAPFPVSLHDLFGCFLLLGMETLQIGGCSIAPFMIAKPIDLLFFFRFLHAFHHGIILDMIHVGHGRFQFRVVVKKRYMFGIESTFLSLLGSWWQIFASSCITAIV